MWRYIAVHKINCYNERQCFHLWSAEDSARFMPALFQAAAFGVAGRRVAWARFPRPRPRLATPPRAHTSIHRRKCVSMICPRTTGCRSDEEEQCLKVCTIAGDIVSSGSEVITTQPPLSTVSSLTVALDWLKLPRLWPFWDHLILSPTQGSPLVIFR